MSELQDLNHKHVLVSAHGLRKPPHTAKELDIWLNRLVIKVGMKVLMGPYSIRCDTMGNEGVTGVVCIETSHASIHVWSECPSPFLRMDLYSCKDFESIDVIDMIREFKPFETSWIILDRNGTQAITKSRETIFIEENSRFYVKEKA